MLYVKFISHKNENETLRTYQGISIEEFERFFRNRFQREEGSIIKIWER